MSTPAMKKEALQGTAKSDTGHAPRRSGTFLQRMDRESPAATESRRIVNHLLRKESENLRSALVTSAEAGEGKSTITAFMAVAAAQYLKKKTLVIDADLRRPIVADLFGLNAKPGLSDWLARNVKKPLIDLVQRTELERLHILTSGSHAANPGALLEAEVIETLIQECSRVFDLVIIDSPPVMPVTDPLMLAAACDTTVLVIKAGVTQRQSVRRAQQLLKQAGGKIAGCVLNDIGRTLPSYYSSSYYAHSKS